MRALWAQLRSRPWRLTPMATEQRPDRYQPSAGKGRTGVVGAAGASMSHKPPVYPNWVKSAPEVRIIRCGKCRGRTPWMLSAPPVAREAAHDCARPSRAISAAGGTHRPRGTSRRAAAGLGGAGRRFDDRHYLARLVLRGLRDLGSG